MKNKVLFIILATILMIIGLQNANAKSLNATFDLNEHDYFNVFREFNNQTPMAKFLYEQGYDILDNMIALGKRETGNSSGGGNTVYITKSITTNYYTIMVFYLDSITIAEEEYKYSFKTNTYGYIFEYDNEMNLLNVECAMPEYKAGNIFAEKIGNLGYWGKGDLTEIFSHFYFTVDNAVRIESIYSKIDLTYVYQNEDYYQFNGYGWLEYLKYFFYQGLVGGGLRDYETNFDLKYYKENSIYDSSSSLKRTFKSVGSVLFMEQEYSIPVGYDSFTIGNTSDIYFLTYKGNPGDSNIYYYSTYPGVGFYSSSYEIMESGLNHLKDAYFVADKSYTTYYVEPKKVYELDNLMNYTFMFYRRTDKYYQTIFYDPDVYELKSRSLTSDSDFTISNNEGSYTFTSSTFQKSYNQSVVGNEAIKNEHGGSSTGENGNTGTFDFSVGTVINGFKNFIGSVSGIASSISSFLSNLPPELVGLLYGGFTMGIIAMIIKIIL